MPSYSAGEAFLQVLPSLRGFAAKLKRELAGIRVGLDVPLDVVLDSRTVTAVRRQLLAAMRTLPAIVLTADSTPADRVIAALRARMDGLAAQTIGLDVSGDQARSELSDIQAQLDRLARESPDIGVRVDAGAASAALAGVERQTRGLDRRDIRLRVDADVARAVISLAQLGLAINAFANREYSFTVRADTFGAVASVAALVAKVGLLSGLVGVVGGFGGALGGLGAAGAVAAGGLLATVVASLGVGDALTALGAQQDGAAAAAKQNAAAQQAAGEAIASAQSRVKQAAEQANRARVEGARSVADAEKSASKQIEQALKSQESAQKTLRQATSDLRREQDTLTAAWESARRSLQDLQSQVAGNSLDQRQAALDLKDATEDLAEAQRIGDPEQIDRAQIAYDRQLQTIKDLQTQGQRLSADNDVAQKKGVAGSDQVVAATERISAATQRQSDAEASLRDASAAVVAARVDGADSVARAQEQAAQRIADSDRQAIEAQRALTQALAQTGDAGSAAADKVASAMAGLSPAAREFVQFLFGAKAQLQSLSAVAAEAFFPPLQAGLQALLAQQPAIEGMVGKLAGAMGAGLNLVLTQLASPEWMSFFGLLADSAGYIIPALFGSLMELASAGAVLIRHLLPLAPASFELLNQLSALLVILAPFVAQLLGGLIPAASAVLSALVPLGPVLAALQPILLVLGQAFATVLLAVLQALAPILVALTPLITEFAVQWAEGLAASLVAVTPLLVTIFTWLSTHASTVVTMVTVVGGLVAAFQPLLWILGLVVAALHGWLIIRVATAALTFFGLQGTVVGSLLLRLLSPLNLIKMALPIIGRLLMMLGRSMLAALGPVGWLITGLTLLYSSNAEFRDAVNSLLPVLMGLVSTLISALMPAFNAIMGAITPLIPLLLDALVPIINVLAQVFINLIGTVLPPLVAFITGQLIPVITTLANIFAAVLVWVITNIVVPAINLLAWIITNVIAPVIVWLYENIVKPMFQSIGAFISWVWTNIIKPTFDFFVFVLTKILGPAIMWFWQNVVQPAFETVGNIIKFVWESVIQPAFQALQGGLDYLSRGFDSTVKTIGNIWNGLRNLLAVPINFLIGTVFNNGIRRAWNLVADLLPGVDPIGELPLIPEFRRGGVYEGVRPGYTPGRDNAVIAVGGGEAIMRPEWTRAVGGDSYVDAANHAARRGGVQGVRAFLTDTVDAGGRDVGQARQRLMGRYPLDNGVQVGLPTFAYGGVVPHVAAAGQEIERLFGRMPGGIGGVGARANASDHPRGLALDFMTMADTGLGNRVSQHMVQNARRLMVKYIIWQQQINQGGGWDGMPDRGSPTANHMDHPHVSFLKAGMAGAAKDFSGEGGGFFDFLGDQIRGFFTDLTDPPISQLRQAFPTPPAFMAIPAEAATMLRDKALDFMLGQGEQAGATGEPAGSGVLRWTPVVSQALAMLGQPLAYIPTTLRRMQQESGGNPRAINNWDSNARRGTPSKGLMQVIDPTFRANRDSRAPNDIWHPLANVLASMKYALGRYGSLPRAYDRPGGYDAGGVANGIGWMWKGTGLDERVLPPQETQAYPTLTRLSQQIESGRLSPPPGMAMQYAAAGSGSAAAGDTFHITAREEHSEERIATEVQRRRDFARRTR